MTDDLVEAVARAIHEHLSRRDIMQYLDNDEDCAGLAKAALAAARPAIMEEAAGIAEHYGETPSARGPAEVTRKAVAQAIRAAGEA